ncbi:MAG: cytochrome c [Bauldia sp.]
MTLRSIVKTVAGSRLGVLGIGSGAALVAAGLIALGGSVTTALAQAPAAPVDGAEVFANNCAGCHGAEGQGGFGPALAGNADLADNALVINQVLNGGEMMPALAASLTDEQIVAVLNYIRSSWGNTNPTPIEITEVTQTRANG